MPIQEDKGKGSVKIHPQAIQQLFEATKLQGGGASFFFLLHEEGGEDGSGGRSAGEGHKMVRFPGKDGRGEGRGEGRGGCLSRLDTG